jgi:hypothetical protein
MKKILLLFVLVFLFNIVGALAADYQVVEGESVILTASQDVSSWVLVDEWRGFSAFQTFLNPQESSVEFFYPFPGTYTVSADGETMTIEVLDLVEDYGFGHQCYVIDTFNCGDIGAYGDVMASNSISAGSIISQGRVHSYGAITIGDYTNPEVFMNRTFVKFPSTLITGDLFFSGLISGGSSNVVNVADELHILGDLGVDGDVISSGDFYTEGELNVENGVSVLGNVIVSGDAQIGSLDVAGDVSVAGDVYVTDDESRIMGSINFDKDCGDSGPRMYEDSTGDIIIDLGIC